MAGVRVSSRVRFHVRSRPGPARSRSPTGSPALSLEHLREPAPEFGARPEPAPESEPVPSRDRPGTGVAFSTRAGAVPGAAHSLRTVRADNRTTGVKPTSRCTVHTDDSPYSPAPRRRCGSEPSLTRRRAGLQRLGLTRDGSPDNGHAGSAAEFNRVGSLIMINPAEVALIFT